ncbi:MULTISPECIES: rhodanese-like domain-containing protein [Legionella]|uniref:Rhodanese-like domain-containing protein n=1 Tax=Legionella septentrionalis TaxID=2498109 RepID=A0A3S1CMR0_9GAMM|nr:MULTISPECIES: rhodanese-like domain-containing protein [Legionella]MCP0913093.1 rhodanese-like domain-containing protein [Legionella sp. 27cVA30]RUQ91543.1 rhodanese-like domain-containing protein [Legionella septentrionalis]RUQ94983.1 rhodanese-like domain-containing protein [Legionella septentrionalis]RUR10593.1 rhodanese-like domain-containing protein [Legionella septentrionalis]RUR13775.1 rhodanese-like domain-containing protein [Legionella septentrionalis]
MGQLGQFITNHWGLWLALVVILLLIFINEAISRKKRGQELSPSAAVDMINHENAIVIDLRDKETFRAGHIINAIQASGEDFTEQRMDKYKNKALILVCARGLQSQTLVAKLRELGFAQPMVLSGGMAAWTNAGLPVVKK